MSNRSSKGLAVVRNSSEEEGMKARILCFAGSTREASFNRRLARAAARAVEEAGGEATLMDLRDHPLPLYDGDLEASAGLPLGVRPLKELFKTHHGLFIASPEYNGSMSAVLKNTLDWVSRPTSDEAGTVPYADKVVALCAASPGALGGLRGLVHLRAVLQSVGALVLSEQLAVGSAASAFTVEDRLADARLQQMLDRTAARLVDVAGRLRP
ncbi:MAG: NAD(P)H-dependent oxidoreductase [Gammaproteobacteria bacterium]|jgi:chromate reductase, NAD(P)H dehydrogenase (quinone)|nr:NAD(P)H-dependent oxidoreductase [Gammaproteobacteria bacterium]MBU0773284.1 NAD(P)H-dependent oxidoreductase [Gammaproteobacteria bacterium]MBU0857805.1 NAD(P)H-dependent oxidoreductase [Gammaproteobacteria bacterium]MBU1846041.1 NAD(P)H-dependent oxidoreductase [Gammaproteobacteria bacterium]